MSTSMHEVFHWGPNTSAGPKKLSLSVAGSQIDFEGPPSPRRQTQSARNAARNRHSMVIVANNQGEDTTMARVECLFSVLVAVCVLELSFCFQAHPSAELL
jgi:hypothetical protein